MPSEIIVKIVGEPAEVCKALSASMDWVGDDFSAYFFLTIDGKPVIREVDDFGKENKQAVAISRIFNTL